MSENTGGDKKRMLELFWQLFQEERGDALIFQKVYGTDWINSELELLRLFWVFLACVKSR